MINDLGIILNKSYYQESKFILKVYTKLFGVCKFIVSSDTKKNNSLQESSLVSLYMKSEPKSLSVPKIELIKAYGNLIINDYIKVFAIKSILSHLNNCLHEKIKDEELFDKILKYFDKVIYEFNFYDYVSLELMILGRSGYGLSLDNCGVSGVFENLVYVSPKTGKAISYNIGKEYHDKLLILPSFINEKVDTRTKDDIENAFKLTGYFFDRYIKKENKDREIFSSVILKNYCTE